MCRLSSAVVECQGTYAMSNSRFQFALEEDHNSHMSHYDPVTLAHMLEGFTRTFSQTSDVAVRMPNAWLHTFNGIVRTELTCRIAQALKRDHFKLMVCVYLHTVHSVDYRSIVIDQLAKRVCSRDLADANPHVSKCTFFSENVQLVSSSMQINRDPSTSSTRIPNTGVINLSCKS